MEQVSPGVNFPENENSVLEFWKERKIFERSLEQTKDNPHYLFYDGPPFATGTPHYGHILVGTLKDIVPRYQTMKGFHVERRFGWDTHGLPIEMITEKELDLNGRHDILEYGIGKFNEACRAGVLRYVAEWEKVTTRLGRWVDFENDYKTMDADFMESVWWVFKQLWDRGSIYEGTRVMPYSWRLSTPLSNFEASSNYKEVQDPAVTVRFRVNELEDVSLLAWTTTPWTLPSNMALCVGPDIQYVEVTTDDGEKVILAKERLSAYFKKGSYKENRSWTALELSKLSYVPLFDFYESESKAGAFRVLVDSYVTTQDGTGIVHQSPAHGEDDHRICLSNGVPLHDPVDAEGKFSSEAPLFEGTNIKDADKEIIKALKEKGLLFKQETIQHSYPFCDRSDTPLIYKAIGAWYVKVEEIAGRMVSHNENIHWVPEHIKHGRFGNWLRDARDWNISRNRYWGNPLPVWKCASCGHYECIGSRKELEAKVGKEVPDLHKHFVDELHWNCSKCQGEMERIPEVLDCWFESGAMPYAQLHYPFENKEIFDEVFPAHFIAEAVDQTRGWFYTLMVLSTLLFDKAPFQNVIVNGMILAEDGKKMSKRLKNYPDPMHVMQTYGADALRLFLISSPVVKGDSLRFSEAGVKDIVRSVLLPFWNVYSFFTTYSGVDNYRPDSNLTGSPNVLDRWIISRFQTLLSRIEQEMDRYQLYAVVPALLDFIEELTNWYVRRSRRRFWSDDIADKQHGYNTLYFVLMGFSRALAPFLPFVTETIYQNLKTSFSDLPESVHLTSYPVADNAITDNELEAAMGLIQQTVGLGRTLRASSKLRTRQPLQSITVVTRNESAAETLRVYGDHIKEELNVKEVLFSADEEGLVDLEVKPNFPVLGPIFGKQMGAVSKELKNLTPEDIRNLESGKTITVLDKELDASSLDIRRTARSGVNIETAGGVTVFYDTDISTELIAEGRARELVNRIQRMRKEADFHVSDRITIFYTADKKLEQSFSQFGEYIKEETLAEALTSASEKGEFTQSHSIDDSEVTITISRSERL